MCVGVYVCACTHRFMCTRKYVAMCENPHGGQRTTLAVFLCYPSPYIFETESLTELEARPFSYTDWPASSWDLLLSHPVPPAQGLQTCFSRALGIQTQLALCGLSHVLTQSACGVTPSPPLLSTVTKLCA